MVGLAQPYLNVIRPGRQQPVLLSRSGCYNTGKVGFGILLSGGRSIHENNTLVLYSTCFCSVRRMHALDGKSAARLLLNKGANVNAKEAVGLTPLHCSALNGHTEVVSLLRKHGGKE